MKRILALLAVVAGLQLAPPAAANALVEHSFEQKFDEADLVVIGTATVVDRRGPRGVGSTATLSVWRTLKGEHRGTIVVSTYSRIAEADPRCCEVGATYMMFLRRAPRDGELYSVNGPYGMVRIAGPRRDVRVIEMPGAASPSEETIELPSSPPPPERPVNLLTIGSCLGPNGVVDLRRVMFLENQSLDLDSAEGRMRVELVRQSVRVRMLDDPLDTRYLRHIASAVAQGEDDADVDLKLALFDGQPLVYWRETYQHRVYRQGLFRIVGHELEPLCEGHGGIGYSH